ncbi:MAG: ThuA domain-containing protein [Acidobacteria bacterium]|nr:ThuA domain-containing protein [Acidobacteriota bacterium]
MRRAGIVVFLTTMVLGVFLGPCQQGFARQRKGRLLYMTLSAGFKHASVAPSEAIVKEIGERSGLFDTTVTQDVGAFTAENLKKYDVVMFYTSGELPFTEAEKTAFIDFVKSGHGFVGVHSATDTLYMWRDYLELIGGYFNDHPWSQQVTVDVVDPSDPIVSFLGKSFQVDDEIYQIADFQYRTSHVLLRLDPNSVNLHKPGVHYRFYGWPLAWTRRDGKGRVFYTALGHHRAIWETQWYQQLLLNGIKYAMGRMK